MAFGKYTRLFQYLKKTPKTYRAVLWLGAASESLDLENMTGVKEEKVQLTDQIKEVMASLVGKIEYIPPKYSAKRIDGKRAYDLAREGKEVELKKSVMELYSIKLLSYSHPFITFEATVSEGSYIRSLAQIIAGKLKVSGTLSYLERLNEGKFFYENEKELNPLEYLDLEVNIYSGSKEWIELGKKLSIDYFEKKEEGEYIIVFDDFFSIIRIQNGEPKYVINKIELNR